MGCRLPCIIWQLGLLALWSLAESEALTVTERQRLKAAAAAGEPLEHPPAKEQPPTPPVTIPYWAQETPYHPLDEDTQSLYTQTVRSSPDYKVVRNAWWHSHRFYAFLSPDKMEEETEVEEGLTVNQAVIRSPVADMKLHLSNLRAAFLPGNTLVVDFPFQTYHDHIGHWAEIMIPIYSMLRSGSWRRDISKNSISISSLYLARVLTPNLNNNMSPWFRAIFSAATRPGLRNPNAELQHVTYADIELFDKKGWLAFESLIVAQDRYTHPRNRKGFAGTEHGDLWRSDKCERYVSHDVVVKFASPAHGQDFRRAIYDSEGLSYLLEKDPPTDFPTDLTLLLGAEEEWPGIVNHEELMTGLHRVAKEFGLKACKVSLTPDASFGTHLDIVSRSKVLIGRHTSLMASSMFLRPNSMVMELLPYKWEWANISMLYYNITQSMGDIHHFAWRPTEYTAAVFTNTSFYKYHTWTPEECHARECLTIWAKQLLKVDIPTVLAYLRTKLTKVIGGARVEELREPWPAAV